MKQFTIWQSVCFALCLLLIPLAGKQRTATPAVPVLSDVSVPAAETTVRLRHASDERVEELPLTEYLWGVLAAEMPASYHAEALKAQTVAAHSYYLCRAASYKDGYDITDDPACDQAFVSRDVARERWGEDYPAMADALDAAVAAVADQILCYENEVALCAYGAISGGRTESAETVWGKPVPYLVPVESVGDLLCPDYLSSAAFSPAQIREALSGLADLPPDHTTWFSSPVYSDSGTVVSLSFGEITLTGAQVRDALSLRSADFDVGFSDDAFRFSVRGYGHLVGMSQYGAQYMALQGETYDQILAWYYPGCVLCTV